MPCLLTLFLEYNGYMAWCGSHDESCLRHVGVGKSCLLLRFSEDSFTNSFITTIG